MKTICEVMVNDVYPGLRALIAKNLINDFKISQKEAAELIGTTQPAISQYMRALRGKKILDFEYVFIETKRIAKDLIDKKIDKDDLPREFCKIGKMLVESKKIDAYKCDIC